MISYAHKLNSELLYEPRKLNKVECTTAKTYLSKYVAEDIASFVLKGRSHKESYFPQLNLLWMFTDLMENLSLYPAASLVTDNTTVKQERRLNQFSDVAYKHAGLVFQQWRSVLIDYQMATNDVIFEEFMRDTGKFLAYFIEYHKYVTKVTKPHPEVAAWYEVLFACIDIKQDLFKFVLEDLLTLAAGMSSQHSGIPCNLTPLKTIFYNSMKEATREAREIFV